MRARGVELGIFMDTFMQQNNIEALSGDGRVGGAAVVGWSVGNVFTLATIANIDAFQADVKARLTSRIHTLIMQGMCTCLCYRLFLFTDKHNSQSHQLKFLAFRAIQITGYPLSTPLYLKILELLQPRSGSRAISNMATSQPAILTSSLGSCPPLFDHRLSSTCHFRSSIPLLIWEQDRLQTFHC